LLENRKYLFEQKTDEEQREFFNDLDRCLRHIDGARRRWSAS
jgi:hypothetical protein